MIFHSQYHLHRQDYEENFTKYGGTPIKNQYLDGYQIPQIIANDDDDYYQDDYDHQGHGAHNRIGGKRLGGYGPYGN
jgi:hypothetical protein